MKKTKKQDEYYLAKTIKYGNITVNTYRPILTDEERKKREEQIMRDIARILSKYPELHEPTQDQD